MKHLQSNLRFLRKKYKYTQDSISEKLNISRSTFSNYENGQSEPDLNMLVKICDLFNCSLDQLVNSDLSTSFNESNFINLLFSEVNYTNLLNDNTNISKLSYDLKNLKNNYLNDRELLISNFEKYLNSLNYKINKIDNILESLKYPND